MYVTREELSLILYEVGKYKWTLSISTFKLDYIKLPTNQNS